MSSMPWRGAVVVAALALCGCAGAGGGALFNAALNTGVALGASAVSRSQGGCYASCPAGTTCNNATGYCDPIPCRGECSPFEECVEEKLFYRCVARSQNNGNIIVNPSQKPSEPQPSDAPKSPEPTP